jgi:hypothetical protein
MTTARPARASDLHGLLALFRVSEVGAIAEPVERAEGILSEMLTREDLALFVSDAGTDVVATCQLITAPNLLRGGRRHGFRERRDTSRPSRSGPRSPGGASRTRGSMGARLPSCAAAKWQAGPKRTFILSRHGIRAGHPRWLRCAATDVMRRPHALASIVSCAAIRRWSRNIGSAITETTDAASRAPSGLP